MLGTIGVVCREVQVAEVKEVSPGRSEIAGHHPETLSEVCLVIDDALPVVEGKRGAGMVRVIVWRSDGAAEVREVNADDVRAP